ncbi:MAG: N-acetylmuramic acid 6-phosphate etherase [Candidatus Gastranaerophilales bacterium]|nr:N-acetylmuramic acid 6-phosphate etherase [Candidatus Gastranaerophilales bacterium]
MNKVILTEQSNPDTVNIDISSTLEMVEMINNEDKKVAAAIELEKENIAKAIDLISSKILSDGHLLYFGAGTSGRLGVLDASECPPTFGVSQDIVRGYIAGGDIALRNAIEGAEDNYEQGKIDFQNAKVEKNDVVVGISASGNPKWLISVLEEAKAKNISTVAITCNPQAKIKEIADITICPIVGQEAITGSSRLKAGTAQKLVLNMLSTGTMVKIGKTYKNFMVDVQPTNVKLKDRAVRFVSEIANVDENRAKEILQKTNYEVKTSIVSILKNIDIETARKLLKDNNGILRKII